MKRDALVIGINQYPFLKDTRTRKVKHLTTPANDAEAIAQLLEKYGEFREVRRLPAVNKDDELQVDPQRMVELEEVKRAITDLFCPQRDQVPETAVLFFAGHGLRRNLGNKTEGYLATSDASPRKELWGISLHWLRKILQDSPIRQQIIWLDCCHSGELFNFTETDLAEYKKGRDRCFIAASRDFQVAYEQREGEHGILTNALIQGLNPKLQSDKWVTNISLVNFVKETLKKAPQHPVHSNSGGQIILTSTQPSIFDVCPYKGLAFFDFNDEDPKYFYGRETLINQLIDKVRENNFLAVLGASGSGKSSAVRAGLLHRLRLGEILPGSDRWQIYQPFTPGEHPLKGLEQVVGFKPDQLQASVKAAPTDRVLLVVDQFEEVFTLCRDKTEREQFFKYLLDALKQLGNKLCLVLVMRADFQNKCSEQEYGGLAAKIDQNLVRVMPMTQDELKQAIIEPGKKVGLEIDRELVNQMIADVSGSPGDLPLMQYTLTELLQQQTLGRLTINDYTRLGGVKEALRKRANQIYESLSNEEQLIAKQIFLELTHLGEETEDTRRQVRQEDLVTQRRSPELVEKVLQRLAEKKLVVTGEQEFEGKSVAVVNIAHEALIRNWDLLGKWLKENREALFVKQDIEEAARDWREKGNRKNAAYLLQGTRLRNAENFCEEYSKTLPLSKIAEDLVRKSVNNRLKNRCFMVSGVIFGGIVLMFAGIFGVNWQSAENQKFANKLAGEAEELMTQAPDSFETSLLLALEAAKRNPSSETNRVLRNGLHLLPRSIKQLQKIQNINRESKYSVDIDFSGNLSIEETKTGKKFLIEKDFINYFINVVETSFDGKYLTIIGETINPRSRIESTILVDLTLQKLVSLGKQESFLLASISQNSNYIATLNWNKNLEIWDTAIGKKISQKPNANGLEQIILSPNGKYIALISSDKLQVAKTFENKELLSSNDFLASNIIFSPDEKYLMGYGGEVLQLWDIDKGIEIKRFATGTEIQNINFNNDGTAFNVLNKDGKVQQLRTTNEWLTSLNHQEPVVCMAFSPDDKYLATLSHYNRTITAHIWDAKNGKKLKEIYVGRDRYSAHGFTGYTYFSRDSKYLITSRGYDDTTIEVWDVISGETSFNEEVIDKSSNEKYSELCSFPTEKGIYSRIHSNDKKSFASINNNTVQLVRVVPENILIDEVCSRLTRNLTQEEWQKYNLSGEYGKTCPNLPLPEINPL